MRIEKFAEELRCFSLGAPRAVKYIRCPVEPQQEGMKWRESNPLAKCIGKHHDRNRGDRRETVEGHFDRLLQSGAIREGNRSERQIPCIVLEVRRNLHDLLPG